MEVATSAHGTSRIVTEPSSVQPASSVSVTVYVPGARLSIKGSVSPVDQRYSYGEVPPDAEAVAVPSFAFGIVSSVLERLRFNKEGLDRVIP